MLQHFLGHALGQINQTVSIKNFNAANELAIDARFIGDGADDIARLHLVFAAHRHAISFHGDTIPLTGRRTGLSELATGFAACFTSLIRCREFFTANGRLALTRWRRRISIEFRLLEFTLVEFGSRPFTQRRRLAHKRGFAWRAYRG